MAKSDFLADIDAAAAVQCVRRTWFDALSEEAQKELLSVRHRWRDGKYTMKRMTLARFVIKAATDRGWKTCDLKRMAEWLAKND
jgi:hypothetical protein